MTVFTLSALVWCIFYRLEDILEKNVAKRDSIFFSVCDEIMLRNVLKLVGSMKTHFFLNFVINYVMVKFTEGYEVCSRIGTPCATEHRRKIEGIIQCGIVGRTP